ncbi:MAG: hypothetical protein C0614_12060 [Desulfuromonas sp.]|nr:MAG: hypothetical protein C0614_12060 [Desulfuromonas sp.]
MTATTGDHGICRDNEHHTLHICQLAKKGLKAEIAARRSQPGFICHNCNAVADRAEDLCNPSPFAPK